MTRLLSCCRTGMRKGLRATAWLLAFIVPVSLVVTVLNWVGILRHVAGWIEPAFRLVGLPGEAALPFVTGALLNIYSGIAAMAPIGLDSRQVTIMALMMLISHNLPVECPVQQRAGSHWLRMLGLRLAMSAAAGLLLNLVLPAASGAAEVRAASGSGTVGLLAMLLEWARSAAWLGGKIAVLVVALMILESVMQEFGVMRVLSLAVRPLLWLLGLPPRTAFLWIVANTLGLAYGAAAIFEEIESGALPREEVELLNRSIAVCHSLLEDTLLFVAVGAWAFWITVPRLALAAGAVWLYRAARTLTPPRRPQGGSSPPLPGPAFTRRSASSPRSRCPSTSP